MVIFRYTFGVGTSRSEAVDFRKVFLEMICCRTYLEKECMITLTPDFQK